jgi:hypothetical protein
VTGSTLAYVFWHSPAPNVSPVDYEAGLDRFHQALASDPPPGFLGSASYRASRVPWSGSDLGGVVYDDWYLVDDWVALGELNHQAIAPPHGPTHDAVARLADGGRGGVYRLLRGEPELAAVRFETWASKPRGVPSEEFAEAFGNGSVPKGSSVWQRQLVLGPAPEFCRRSSAAPRSVGDGERRVEVRPVWPRHSG